ncbi:GNAT family N-acetyltransferase [Conexibacter woesei]|uniref:GCN5-related N-acetyltransferase n=1 Tax=Conexibacter woesei (strain DSM 14684 / CCUG 47730 / CIP 108061 / JCM 11494 / NBRC 100937 / ID131577) TaxID=469383 RepID=D3F151_CONWI|nr:GNAT family N-acetyltransferase [Conexibacter woesei]ADB50127.1 GCN5-related N-acetyltransferase [Conexibacter woesei DSM 14684]
MGPRGEDVTFARVGDGSLDALVAAAVADAAPDDVTPPLTDGDGWTPERIAWLRAYHRERQGSLDDPPFEVSWAVRSGERVLGAVRLRRTAPGEAETGIWLVRAVRGAGVGTRAVAFALERAREHDDLRCVRATTTAGNAAAQALLRRLGFVVAASDDDGGAAEVHATCALRTGPVPSGQPGRPAQGI